MLIKNEHQLLLGDDGAAIDVCKGGKQSNRQAVEVEAPGTTIGRPGPAAGRAESLWPFWLPGPGQAGCANSNPDGRRPRLRRAARAWARMGARGWCSGWERAARRGCSDGNSGNDSAREWGSGGSAGGWGSGGSAAARVLRRQRLQQLQRGCSGAGEGSIERNA
jgi:hypothetical protein